MTTISSHVIALLLIYLQAAKLNCEAEKWSYDESKHNGPTNWKKTYEGCSGLKQSPLDIKHTITSDHVTSLDLDGYDELVKRANWTNNGHTVSLDLNNHNAQIKGGCLKAKYKLIQLHFHWGSNDSLGSEHYLNGAAFPMEAHFVHRKAEYHTNDEALKHKDGLAVLGVFFTSKNSNVTGLDPLIRAVESVKLAGSNNVIPDSIMKLSSMLPRNLEKFYCYEDGSLTTPGCNESVIWTLLEDKVVIGKDQIKAFRSLKFSDGTDMVNNFRPLQDRNSRIIYRSSGIRDVAAPSQVFLPLLFLLFRTYYMDLSSWIIR